MTIRQALAGGGVALAALVAVGCDGDDQEIIRNQTSGVNGDSPALVGADAGLAPATFASVGPYPAPHPDPPQVRTLGGSMLQNPRLVPVFWPADDEETYVRQFLDAYVASDVYRTQTSEYGIGPATVTAAAHPAGSEPAAVTDSAIQAWLLAQLDAPSSVLPPPDANTVYLLYFPSGVHIGADEFEIGCQDFYGYHQSVSWHGQDVAYAVFPRCDRFLGLQADEQLTAASNHEIVEAATDPYPGIEPAYEEVDPPHSFWEFEVGGSEIADMCQLLIGSFGLPLGFPWNVQRTWSNAGALGGHEPCVPSPAGPYFAAAPVQPDTATYVDDNGATRTTNAVKIGLDGRATIDVDLFSDGPTDAPWKLIAVDDTTVHGSSQTLAFSWDQDTGSNGDVRKLTIAVVQAPTNHVEGFWIFSELHGRTTAWLGVVVNP